MVAPQIHPPCLTPSAEICRHALIRCLESRCKHGRWLEAVSSARDPRFFFFAKNEQDVVGGSQEEIDEKKTIEAFKGDAFMEIKYHLMKKLEATSEVPPELRLILNSGMI